MKVAAVIPARGGSKGIPRKNIKAIQGKPLIAWSIDAARESKLLSEFFVSTDDEEIARVARECGAPVLMRPPELATDESKTVDLLQHLAGQKPEMDAFCVLQPTSPLRYPGLIDECITEYADGDYDTLATGFLCKFREFGTHGNERRQDYKGFFYDDGNVYVIDRALAAAGRWSGDRICKKEIPKEYNFEIDDEVDILLLETLLKRYA
ncbi:MAG: acylneuraminate cytidylyltransferase family protein [bacterium]|nr:acylneuraminate cytidylyltransferase family protein [bacterium]